MIRVHTVFGARQTGVHRDTCGVIRHPDDRSDPVVFLRQTHSDRVVTLENSTPDALCDADAIVTVLPHVKLAIKTADCAPVMLADQTHGVIGAVHSGWQGTLQNIVAKTVEAMVSHGAEASTLHATIGPCLQRDNFEMGPEVRQQFVDRNPLYGRFFHARSDSDKHLFDNTGLLVWQLQQCGVTRITADPACTRTLADTYYSHRARHTDPVHDTMRNVSLIWMDD